jgi:hypothetical protein
MANTCAVHPGALAVFTCSRCGSFACPDCTSSTDLLCRACDRLRGSVLGTDLSAGGLIGHSFALVAKFGAAVAAFAAVEAIASTGVAMIGAALPEGTATVVAIALLGIAISTVVQGAWISLLASAAQGAPMGIGAALGRGGSVALPLFACNLILGLGVGLAMLLLIVPGVILALGWCAAGPSVVVSRQGPIEALGESWGLTGGHKGSLFVALLGTGIVAVVVAGAIEFAGGMAIAVVPGARLVVNLGTSVISSFAMAPVLTVPVLAYLRLQRNFTAD